MKTEHQKIHSTCPPTCCFIEYLEITEEDIRQFDFSQNRPTFDHNNQRINYNWNELLEQMPYLFIDDIPSAQEHDSINLPDELLFEPNLPIPQVPNNSPLDLNDLHGLDYINNIHTEDDILFNLEHLYLNNSLL